MNSIWTDTVSLPSFAPLEGEVKTEVLIIGGGMAGVLCAYLLQEKGVDYRLVEGRRIGCGVTCNTTAKITVQHGLLYHKLLQSAGVEIANLYWQANQKAVDKYRELGQVIDCDFETKTSFLYAREDGQKLEQEAEALRKIGCKVTLSESSELPFPTAGVLGIEQQGQFHPLKLVAGIVQNLHIYENTFVKELKENLAVTEHGKGL